MSIEYDLMEDYLEGGSDLDIEQLDLYEKEWRILDDLNLAGINYDWRRRFLEHEQDKIKMNPEIWRYYDNEIAKDKLHWEETLIDLSHHYDVPIELIISLLSDSHSDLFDYKFIPVQIPLPF